MRGEDIQEVFRRFQAANPHPQTELIYTNPFTLLVAVVLSARATDVSVNKATKDLFPSVDTPQKLLALGEDGLKGYIKTIGLYPTKAKNILALCQQLIEHHDGKVPQTREALEALPGVGRKTANVVLNVVFDQPTLAVDTHIFRVSNRIGLIKAKTVEAAEKQLLERIPQTYIPHAHHWLILHGRYVCKARKPECYRCPIRDLCEYPDKMD